MDRNRAPQPVELLLVESEPRAGASLGDDLERAGLVQDWKAVTTPALALDHLETRAALRGATPRVLVLLDARLPDDGARKLLATMRASRPLQAVQVLVLGATEAQQEELALFRPSGFLRRPLGLESFVAALREAGSYRLQVMGEPAPLEPFVEAPPSSSSRQGGMPARLHLLLIEDSPSIALLLRDALLSDENESQFELTHVQRLGAAERSLTASRFDLVMMDLWLPDSQGIDSYRRVRRLAPNSPVIVLTNLDDEATGAQALREGADDYLFKGQLTPGDVARTARYALARHAHQDQRQRVRKLEAVGRLAAGVAHDLNNILTIVRGNADLLRSAAPSADVEHSAGEIQDAVERAMSLARQLLTFSRQQAMLRRPIDLNRVVSDYQLTLRRQLGRGTKLELFLDEALPLVLADVGMLEQALLNLAMNARDAMPNGGKLVIETSSLELGPEAALAQPDAYAGRFVRLTVTDNGQGMSAEVLSRIFEPFFSTKGGAGSGLGLATVHGIVKQHKGWLTVKSRVGQGTSFDLLLPTTDEAPVLTAAKPPLHGGTETVLLVEDEAVLRRLTARVLRLNGYKVLEAASAEEAQACWDAHVDEIALLLADLVLPDDVSGRRLAETLSAARPELKVVFTSGYSPDFVAQGFVLEEGVNFLQKPYPLANVLRVVRTRLDEAT